MKIPKILFITLLLCSSIGFAQTHTYFNKIVEGGDSLNITLTSILEVNNEYIAFGGQGGLDGDKKIMAYKFDSLGNTIWTSIIDEDPEIYLTFVNKLLIQTVDGDFIGAYLKRKQIGDQTYDIAVARFSGDGELIWKYHYGTSNAIQNCYRMIATQDGGAIVVGTNQVVIPGAYYKDMYVLKVDAQGQFEWHNTFSSEQNSLAFSIIELDDGNYIIGGGGYQQSTGFADIMLVKINEEGELLEQKFIGTSMSECASIISKWKENSFLLTSCIRDGSEYDIYILEIDNNLNVIWSNTLYQIENQGSIQQLIIKPDKGFIGVGHFDNMLYKDNPYIIDFDSLANVNWYTTPTLNNNQDCYLRGMDTTPDGGYILAGAQFTGQQKGWIYKIDSLGNNCSFIGCDSIYTVQDTIIEPIDTISEPIDTNMVYLQTTTSNLYQLYPNPTNGKIWLEYNIPFSHNFASIQFLDTNGKLVAQQWLESGKHTIPFNLSFLKNGIYFYQIYQQNQLLNTGKIILEK